MDAGAVLITGGSRGIGAAVARRLGRLGRRICISYRADAESARAVVAEVVASGGEAIAVQADMARPEDTERLFVTVDTELGTLTGLVNNVGILERQCRVDEMDAGRLQRIMSANVVGPFLCAAQAVRRMSTLHGGAGGAIVNVSSAASRLGSPGEYVDYAASKGAVDTLTIGLAREVAGEGIRVNVVRPGIIETDIHASGGQPDRAARLGPALPVGRAGRPGEVAAAVRWLLSDEASYCTGSILDVTGGR